MKITENKRNEFIVIALCAVILLPIIAVSFFNRPAADDYSYSLLTYATVQSGAGPFALLKAAWDTNIQFYNVWQGLYTSAFLLSLQPGIFGEQYYALSTIIVILFTYLPLLGAIHIINRHFFRKSAVFSAAFSIAVYTMLIIWMPDINDGLFWFNGAMNYTPYAFVNLYSLCLLLDAFSADRNKKIRCVVISTLLAFLTSGGNHVTAFANILLLLIACAVCFSKKKFYPVFPFIAACAGFIIMFTAPGTAVRQAYFESPGAVTTVIRTAMHVHGLASQWITIKWLLSLLVLTPAAIEFGYKNKHLFSKKSIIYIALSVVAAIAIICGMFCVPFYAMRDFGMGRVTNVIWITFNFLSWFIYFFAVGLLVAKDFINADKILNLKYVKTLRLACVTGGLCLMVIIFENSLASWPVKAASELVHGVPQKYAQEMDERIALYNDSSLPEVAVEPVKQKSEFLHSVELSTVPNEWPNEAMCAYYGKDIYLKD